MTFRPYLTFAGNCRQAFDKYKQVFGGELFVMTMSDMPSEPGSTPPPDVDPNAIMHAALTHGDAVLMGADDPMGNFKGKVDGMCVAHSVADVPEAKRIFDALADGGEVQMPLAETFFSPAFGMCTDRFGTPWMIMVDQPAQG
jgi:PhnB protein